MKSEALRTIVQESEHFPTTEPFHLTIRDLYSEECRDVPIYVTINKRESDAAMTEAAFDRKTAAAAQQDGWAIDSEKKKLIEGKTVDGVDADGVVKDKNGRPLFTVTLRYFNVLKECDGLCEERMQLKETERESGEYGEDEGGFGYGKVSWGGLGGLAYVRECVGT